MTTEGNPTVEEALAQVVVYGVALPPLVKVEFTNDLGRLIEAVRREERERYEHNLSTTWKDLALESQRQVRELLACARSSEEAGNGQ